MSYFDDNEERIVNGPHGRHSSRRTSGASDIVEIAADIKHETEKAFLLDGGDGKPVWVAKSQIEQNDDGTFSMPEWLAKEKGFL